MKLCIVEVATDNTALRIFKNLKQAIRAGVPITTMERAQAVDQIRTKIFKKCDYACTNCGKLVTIDTGHMHEQIHRGQVLKVSEFEYESGQISVANSIVLCDNCHRNDPVAGHGKRKPQWSGQA